MKKVFSQPKSINEALPTFLDLQILDIPYRFHLLHAAIKEVHKRGDPKDLPEHQHDVYHIVLFNEGENKFSVGGEVYRSRPGMLAVTSPSQRHLFTPLNRGEVTYSEISFCWTAHEKNLGVDFTEVMQVIFGGDSCDLCAPFQLNEAELQRMQRSYGRIFDMLQMTGEMVWPQIYLAVLQLLAEAFGFMQSRAGRPLVPERTAREVRDYMMRNYARVISTELLGREFNCSPRHLLRRFQNRFGQSPIDFLRDYRISIAKHSLLTTDRSCQQIASDVGFNDSYYFSRTFKKLTGCSPLQWRKVHKRDESVGSDS